MIERRGHKMPTMAGSVGGGRDAAVLAYSYGVLSFYTVRGKLLQLHTFITCYTGVLLTGYLAMWATYLVSPFVSLLRSLVLISGVVTPPGQFFGVFPEQSGWVATFSR